MWRVFLFLLVVAGLAFVLARFADQPGSLAIEWLGYHVETSVFAAVLLLIAALFALALLVGLLRWLITRPGAIARFLRGRREKRGLAALSQGLLAAGAGDEAQAQRYAMLARRSLPHEPLTAVLRARVAEMQGDRATARRIYQAMTEMVEPETVLFGLHGLYLEAVRENEAEAARQFAERAMRLKPELAWSVNALFEMACRAGDWQGALDALEVARRHGHVDRKTANRRRAVLLTAQAMAAEGEDMDRARELAIEAHKLAPDLVPAAELAGRLIAAKGQMSRAARLLARTWRLSPHPDIAQAYAFLRPGDSPRDRLKRARALAAMRPDSVEGPIAVANAAIEAHDLDAARAALAPLLEDAPSARICMLMARIEAAAGDQGRVREWLARALRAPRDPAWTADGVVSQRWAPVSPVSGVLDAFEWKVPVAVLGGDAAQTAIDELVSASAPTIMAHVAPEPPELPEPVDAGPAPPPPSPLPAPAAAPQEKAQPAPVGDKQEAPQAEGSPAQRPPRKPRSPESGARPQPEIFVPPRAPDDPGPAGNDVEEGADPADNLARSRP